jgi:nucleoside 2-deoxyribosyltransferase
MHGCAFGIGIFERITTEDFNPNVSLELGYMMALGKPVCLLKDKYLNFLHTDLVGRLYLPFDPQDPETSIPNVLEKWAKDKRIVT